MAPLATGALSGLASTGVSKILGNDITIPLTKQQEIVIINSNCEEVRPGVVSYDEDTRKKVYLIKLTHTGRFCKNDVILFKFTNAADIRVTIFGN